MVAVLVSRVVRDRLAVLTGACATTASEIQAHLAEMEQRRVPSAEEFRTRTMRRIGRKWTVPLSGVLAVVRLGEQPLKLELDAYITPYSRQQHLAAAVDADLLTSELWDAGFTKVSMRSRQPTHSSFFAIACSVTLYCRRRPKLIDAVSDWSGRN